MTVVLAARLFYIGIHYETAAYCQRAGTSIYISM